MSGRKDFRRRAKKSPAMLSSRGPPQREKNELRQEAGAGTGGPNVDNRALDQPRFVNKKIAVGGRPQKLPQAVARACAAN